MFVLISAVMAGWGPSVFSAYSHWWLVPLIACHLGACVGAGLHLLLGTISRTCEDFLISFVIRLYFSHCF